MPTHKIRRLPPLRGREDQIVTHHDGDPSRSHVHARGNVRNAQITTGGTATASTTQLTAEIDLV